jgi:hypothetical protein
VTARRTTATTPSAARWERRRARYARRRAAAGTPAGRLQAAYDYLRGALGDPDIPEARRHRAAAAAADHLAATAEALWAAQAGGRLR